MLRQISDFMNWERSAVSAVMSSCGLEGRAVARLLCVSTSLLLFPPPSTRGGNLFFLLTHDAHLRLCTKTRHRHFYSSDMAETQAVVGLMNWADSIKFEAWYCNATQMAHKTPSVCFFFHLTIKSTCSMSYASQ